MPLMNQKQRAKTALIEVLIPLLKSLIFVKKVASTFFIFVIFKPLAFISKSLFYKPLVKLYGYYILLLKRAREINLRNNSKFFLIKKFLAPIIIIVIALATISFNLINQQNFGNRTDKMYKAVASNLAQNEFDTAAPEELIMESAGTEATCTTTLAQYIASDAIAPEKKITTNTVPVNDDRTASCLTQSGEAIIKPGAIAAADGQMGCLMKLHRDWQLSGDDDFLRSLWPAARKALEFCRIPGGWDADRDGVMEGCQHNTMGVEYYGPNPQMGGWYLGALRAGEEMARYLGDTEFADTCSGLAEQGSRWLDDNLFNGDYYEHEIRPPKSEDDIAAGLRYPGLGARDLSDPDWQLGAACLVDQLVGQCMAHVCGLGYLLDKRNVRKTLRSIMRYNFKEKLYDHFNHLRSFALQDESALLMATYPKGRRPKLPFPYCNEVMTGFEYTAAVHQLYEGQVAQGLKCIAAIRRRYDGKRRNPFDEAECGHHYARAMASWAAVLALTGFHYSAVTGTMRFAAREGTHFWSTGAAWGTCTIKQQRDGWKAKLEVLHGSLRLTRLHVGSEDCTDTLAVKKRPRS